MIVTNQGKLDQSANCAMDDSTVTIEFLRARLLSERSVSQTARQRADELARRVEKLEEQLRIVSVQRMKAEKATANVLTILESNGLSDGSDAFDSSSDQDAHSEFGLVNGCPKEVESSANSKSRKGKSEEHSGSDLDFSPSPGRSLSWKSSKDDTGSIKRCKDPSPRRHTASACSSTKHRSGKSCRQIRQREARDRDMEKALEQQAELIERYDEMEKTQREWEEKFRENASSTPDSCDPGNRSDVTEEAPYEVKEQSPHIVGTIASPTQIAKPEGDNLPKVKSDVNFQLAVNGEQKISIQRKQNEVQVGNNYGSSLSSPHQHLQPHGHSPKDSPESQSTRNLLSNRASDVNKDKASGSQSELYALVPHKAPKELGILEALNLAKQTLQQQMNNKIPSVGSTLAGTSYDPSLSTTVPGDKPEIPVGSPGLFRLPTDFPAGASDITSVVGPVGTSYDPALMTTAAGDKAEMPAGCSGLFRLPTDFSGRISGGEGNFYPRNGRSSLGDELLGSSRANGVSSSAIPSLGNYQYGKPNQPAAASNQLLGVQQYSDPMANLSAGDHMLPGKQYPEGGSRIPTQGHYMDPRVDLGSASSRNAYPRFPGSPAYGDLMFRMPSSSEGFSTFPPVRIADGILTSPASPGYGDLMLRQTPSSEGFSTFPPGGITDGIPPSDRFSFSSPYRSDMYR